MSNTGKFDMTYGKVTVTNSVNHLALATQGKERVDQDIKSKAIHALGTAAYKKSYVESYIPSHDMSKEITHIVTILSNKEAESIVQHVERLEKEIKIYRKLLSQATDLRDTELDLVVEDTKIKQED